jgi:septal ring factor EnvC (AmiA/AmiB activator)
MMDAKKRRIYKQPVDMAPVIREANIPDSQTQILQDMAIMRRMIEEQSVKIKVLERTLKKHEKAIRKLDE